MRYLVESYLPASRRLDLTELTARARSAAEELAGEGGALRHVESIFVPEDEMFLLVYEAESARMVREASRRAGIACERVLEAVGDPQGDDRYPEGGSS